MTWTDPDGVHIPGTGDVAPAAWGVVVNDDLNFLARPPRCVVNGSAPQSVPNNTSTALLADEETRDTDGMHSTVTENSRITIQTDGDYGFRSVVLYAADADGNRNVRFRLNGTTNFSDVQVGAAAAGSMGLVTSGSRALVAGDYVETVVQHLAGANLDITLREFSAVLESVP